MLQRDKKNSWTDKCKLNRHMCLYLLLPKQGFFVREERRYMCDVFVKTRWRHHWVHSGLSCWQPSVQPSSVGLWTEQGTAFQVAQKVQIWCCAAITKMVPVNSMANYRPSVYPIWIMYLTHWVLEGVQVGHVLVKCWEINLLCCKGESKIRYFHFSWYFGRWFTKFGQ